jgi:8-oxo-dGTP pyrophosphatase MutT (NUDIX family)
MLVPIGSELLVALISLRGGMVLALPKGHIEPGETAAQAAERETREETGIAGTLLGPLEEISYFYWSRAQGARVAKRVEFFLFAYRSGSPARHDAEVDAVRLVPLAEAARALSYPGERRVMEAALARLAAGGHEPPGANEHH